MNVEVLAEFWSPLTACPVILTADDVIVKCNQPLEVRVTRTVVGDDYGSWAEYDIGFPCGHTLEDMKKSIAMEEYI